jgi:putative ABC transport system permease protein
VIGASVARETGLKVGDTFQPTHGVQEEGHAHDPFTVVGILIPTGTPSDRGLFINIEGFYLQEDHAKPGPAHEAKHAADDPDAHDHDAHEKDGDALESKERDAQEQDGDPEPGAPQPTDEDACVLQPGDDHAHDDHAHDDHDHGHDARDHHHHRHEPLPESQREVTAILVRTNGPMALGLDNVINEGNEAQAVSPIREVVVLLDTFVRPLEYVFLGLAILIVIVAGVGMMVAMYNSMSERRREIAIMRALGASRQAVTTIILLESILLALAGGLLGVLLGHGLLAVASPYVIEFSHVSVGFLQFEPIELGLIPGLVVLATLVGLVPALTAYRTDVSHALSASP